MNTFIQQITVVLVVLVVGGIIASVASGENKIKNLVKKIAGGKKDVCDSSVKRPKGHETTIIKKKTNNTNGQQGEWQILVRDKTNKYTIKKVSLSTASLTGEPFKIGRGDDCDLKLNNSYVSEEHALIIYDDESENIVYIDSGSSNGTYINSYYDGNGYIEGEKIETVAIENGLTLYLWDTPIVFSRMCGNSTNTTSTDSD